MTETTYGRCCGMDDTPGAGPYGHLATIDQRLDSVQRLAVALFSIQLGALGIVDAHPFPLYYPGMPALIRARAILAARKGDDL